MYAHPQDKSVITLLLISVLLPAIVEVIAILFIKEKEITEQLKICALIFENLVTAVCCILIGCLYRKMLKEDLRKTLKQKKKLFCFMALDLLMGGIFIFFKGADMSILDELSLSWDPLQTIFIVLFFFRVVLFAPFIEEIAFRRIFFQLIKKDNSLLKALKASKYRTVIWLLVLMIVNSTVFALFHFGTEIDFFPVFFIYFLVGGFVLCLCCDICDTISSSIILHMVYNSCIVLRIIIHYLYNMIKNL